MIRSVRTSLPPLVLVLTLIPAASPSQDSDGADPRETRGMALEKMIGSPGEAPLEAFIEEHVDASLVDRMTRESLLNLLRRIRTACASSGGIMAKPDGDHGLTMAFMTPASVHRVQLQVSPEAPYKIVSLSMETGDRDRQTRERWSWEDVTSRLDAAAADGFAGTVLLVRDGKVRLHRGYGYADAERRIANGENTVFAIGSTPIDFTRAAILKLEEEGRLETSERISAYFPDVPDDKRTMTIDHILQSRSGLPNFHDIPGVDADPDLTWIDRDEAVRRILGSELLFAPGEGEAHSHSAWTLLAALVEVVSKQPYENYLEERFFGPLGMRDTGLYEKARTLGADRVAVGQVANRFVTNSPAHWGRTSWLVMGSGGMVSSCADLHRWQEELRGGRVLSEAALAKYEPGGVFMGGNDRGFFTMYAVSRNAMMFMCSNADDGGGPARNVGRSLAGLVMSP